METTKLNTVDYELEGRVYRLSCNMNVLADVQDEYEGKILRLRQQYFFSAASIADILQIHLIQYGTLAFLAAMLTDAADTQGITDENGLPLRFTSKQLGRALTMHPTRAAGTRFYPVIQAAVTPPEEEPGEKTSEDEKN